MGCREKRAPGTKKCEDQSILFLVLTLLSSDAQLTSVEITAGDRLALTMGSGNSDAKNTLYCHSMATGAPIREEAAGAVPCSLMERCGIRVILATEGCFKAVELDAVWLFRVTLRLRNFADHARMHGGHLLGRLVGFSKTMTPLDAYWHP